MSKRFGICTLIACAAFLLFGPAAVAQPRTAAPYAWQPDGLSSLTALFRSKAAPARILRVDGPTRLTTGEDGAFTALANLETAALPLQSQWHFGDGATAVGLAAKHRFETPGTYYVRLTLTNRFGSTTDSLLVQVTAPQEDRAPRTEKQVEER